jgi:hypothetical protein
MWTRRHVDVLISVPEEPKLACNSSWRNYISTVTARACSCLVSHTYMREAVAYSAKPFGPTVELVPRKICNPLRDSSCLCVLSLRSCGDYHITVLMYEGRSEGIARLWMQ